MLPGVAWCCLVLTGFALVLPFSCALVGGGAVRRLPVQGVWLELVVVQLVLL